MRVAGTQKHPVAGKRCFCVVVGYLRQHCQQRLRIEAPVALRGGGWFDPPLSPVADAADGSDGVLGSVLAHGRYPIVRVPNRLSRAKTISIQRSAGRVTLYRRGL